MEPQGRASAEQESDWSDVDAAGESDQTLPKTKTRRREEMRNGLLKMKAMAQSTLDRINTGLDYLQPIQNNNEARSRQIKILGPFTSNILETFEVLINEGKKLECAIRNYPEPKGFQNSSDAYKDTAKREEVSHSQEDMAMAALDFGNLTSAVIIPPIMDSTSDLIISNLDGKENNNEINSNSETTVIPQMDSTADLPSSTLDGKEDNNENNFNSETTVILPQIMESTTELPISTLDGKEDNEINSNSETTEGSQNEILETVNKNCFVKLTPLSNTQLEKANELWKNSYFQNQLESTNVLDLETYCFKPTASSVLSSTSIENEVTTFNRINDDFANLEKTLIEMVIELNQFQNGCYSNIETEIEEFEEDSDDCSSNSDSEIFTDDSKVHEPTLKRVGKGVQEAKENRSKVLEWLEKDGAGASLKDSDSSFEYSDSETEDILNPIISTNEREGSRIEEEPDNDNVFIDPPIDGGLTLSRLSDDDDDDLDLYSNPSEANGDEDSGPEAETQEDRRKIIKRIKKRSHSNEKVKFDDGLSAEELKSISQLNGTQTQKGNPSASNNNNGLKSLTEAEEQEIQIINSSDEESDWDIASQRKRICTKRPLKDEQVEITISSSSSDVIASDDENEKEVTFLGTSKKKKSSGTMSTPKRWKRLRSKSPSSTDFSDEECHANKKPRLDPVDISRTNHSNKAEDKSSGSKSTPTISDRQTVDKLEISLILINSPQLDNNTKDMSTICLPQKVRGRRNIRDIEDSDDSQDHSQELERDSQKEIIDRIKGNLALKSSESGEPLIVVDNSIASRLKPHQVEGVAFLWSTCGEDDGGDTDKSYGCILSHCMGLGKTVQALAFLHTMLAHPVLQVKYCLVLCPLNIVTNWENECKLWLKDTSHKVKIHNLSSSSTLKRRMQALKHYKDVGGICILHYDGLLSYLGRTTSKSKTDNGDHNPPIVPPRKKELVKLAEEVFLEDTNILVCDEGHLLRNKNTNLYSEVQKIKTKRKIILTGTPIQNNVKEYFYMIDLVRPSALGTFPQYCNQYKNPIENGFYYDSTEADILLARKRVYKLTLKACGYMQRKSFKILADFIPPKYEYSIFINLSTLQGKLYGEYLRGLQINNELLVDKVDSKGCKKKRRRVFLTHYNLLQRVTCHPKLVYTTTTNQKPPNKKRKKEEPEAEEEEEEQYFEDTSWFDDIIPGSERENISRKWELGAKLIVLKDILQTAIKHKEKLLIFSKWISTLDCIHEFLKKGLFGLGLDNLEENEDYFRIDGNVRAAQRTAACEKFNTTERAKFFLITTKAGGLGVNLAEANRVVLFDVSMNPSDDEQSIYRIYRLGQTRPCYIYRFISRGGMEERTYNRCLIKLSVAGRVVDGNQSGRSVKIEDTRAMYVYNPNSVPIQSTDRNKEIEDPLMKELLENDKKGIIASYLEHDSLLEDVAGEHLNEQEKEQVKNEPEHTEEEVKKKGKKSKEDGGQKKKPGKKSKAEKENSGKEASEAEPQPSTSSNPN